VLYAGQLYMRKENFADARQLLEPSWRRNKCQNAGIAAQAQSLLEGTHPR